MAWTHKNRKEIKVIINIPQQQGGRRTYPQDEVKKDKVFQKIIGQMEEECIQLALQNHQETKNTLASD